MNAKKVLFFKTKAYTPLCTGVEHYYDIAIRAEDVEFVTSGEVEGKCEIKLYKGSTIFVAESIDDILKKINDLSI